MTDPARVETALARARRAVRVLRALVWLSACTIPLTAWALLFGTLAEALVVMLVQIGMALGSLLAGAYARRVLRAVDEILLAMRDAAV